MDYLDQLEGILGPGEKHPLPELFRMEMLGLNEMLMEIEMSPPGSRLQVRLEKQLRGWMERLYKEAEPDIADYVSGNATVKQAALLKDFYVKEKYLLRILERLSTFASRDKGS